MSTDNPIILELAHPKFIQKETWLKKHLQRALDQPFISFSEVVKKYENGIYLIYDANELLYIGMTYRAGHNRLKEIIGGFRKHSFNRKLMAEYYRGRGYEMHVLSIKNHYRDWIENGPSNAEELLEIQQEVNEAIKRDLRYKFYEYNYDRIESLEHYAVATLQPLYND